jgi:radical SAM protein with 4Fe4S-binding SPASM domain
MALSDAELADFLSRLSFNDTILNELLLLGIGANLTYKCAAGIETLQVTPDMEFYPCMFTQYPDLRMGDIESGIDAAWLQRFEPRRHAGAEPECAGCELASVCGGCCLDWAHKDPLGNGYFSPTECAYRRGLVKAVKSFLENLKGKPFAMEALQKQFNLCNQEWQPKQKGD